jgi:DNA-binding CsgD family transcriptional regulator
MPRGSSTRVRLHDLTDTQRQVLDLIAQGKTNYEIGQALGLTLDGAKYHVTEILNKLGVDSREGAAAIAGIPSRRASLASRLASRRVLATAAAAAAVVIGVGAVLGLLSEGDESSVPVMRVAFLQGAPFTQEVRIVVVDADGNQHPIGDPGGFRRLAWSSDARHLMAYEAGENSQHVWIFDTESGHAAGWEPAGISSFAWSPDGRHLAVVSDESLSIRDGEGTEVAAFVGPFPARLNQQSAALVWSPDSRVVAADATESLVLLGPDGTQQTIDLPQSATEGGSIVPMWDEPSILQVTSIGPLGNGDDPLLIQAWELELSDPGGTWVEISPELPGAFSTQAGMEAARAAAGGELLHGCIERTADSNGLVWGFVTADGERLKAVVVQRGDDLTVITAPDDIWPVAQMPCVAAVIAR